MYIMYEVKIKSEFFTGLIPFSIVNTMYSSGFTDWFIVLYYGILTFEELQNNTGFYG